MQFFADVEPALQLVREFVGKIHDTRGCAAVFDIDDTVLRAEDAQPIAAVAALARHVRRRMPLYFVTGRTSSRKCFDVTMRQLQRAGLEFDGLFLKPAGWGLGVAKLRLREFVEHKEKVRIILNVGNCWTDLLPEPPRKHDPKIIVVFCANDCVNVKLPDVYADGDTK